MSVYRTVPLQLVRAIVAAAVAAATTTAVVASTPRPAVRGRTWPSRLALPGGIKVHPVRACAATADPVIVSPRQRLPSSPPPRPSPLPRPPAPAGTMTDVTFRLYASRPAADTYLRVVGGHPALGGWSPATAPGLMVPTADGDDDAPAVVTVSLPPGETVEYKYARVDAVARTVTWEGADNRRLVVAPGAAIVDHWEGGESPALPCEGIVVPPPPPAVGSTAAPALTEEAAAAPLTADASAPLADAPAPAADASTSLADAPALPADAPAPPAGGSTPSADATSTVAADASASLPVVAPAPPADAPVPPPGVGAELLGEAPAPTHAAPASADAQGAPAADDLAAAGADTHAGAGGDGGGGEGEPAAKGGGDANIFKHLSSGVSSLLRAMSRQDGGRGRRNDAGPPPANGVAQAES